MEISGELWVEVVSITNHLIKGNKWLFSLKYEENTWNTNMELQVGKLFFTTDIGKYPYY